MERTTPVVVVVAVGETKKKGAGLRSIALAVVFSVGPMTLSALGADPASTPAKPAATPAPKPSATPVPAPTPAPITAKPQAAAATPTPEQLQQQQQQEQDRKALETLNQAKQAYEQKNFGVSVAKY